MARMSRWMVAVLAALLVLGGTVPAGAAIHRSDFPSKASVKTVLKGSGHWVRDTTIDGPLGAKPANCRSDRPFRGAKESRDAFYAGPLRGHPTLSGATEISIYRYRSVKAAKRAMARAALFPSSCSHSVEWVCRDCDGIWDAYRTPAAGRAIGTQSVAWTERRVGMGVSSHRVVIARTGRTVVVTDVGRQGDPVSMRTPKKPTWKQTDRIARRALAKAI